MQEHIRYCAGSCISLPQCCTRQKKKVQAALPPPLKWWLIYATLQKMSGYFLHERIENKHKKRGQVRNDTHVRDTSPPFAGNQDRRISYVLRSRACQYAVTYIVSSRYDDSLTRHTRYSNTSAIVSSLGQHYREPAVSGTTILSTGSIWYKTTEYRQFLLQEY